jgi:hypothetical protein
VVDEVDGERERERESTSDSRVIRFYMRECSITETKKPIASTSHHSADGEKKTQSRDGGEKKITRWQ